MAEKLWGGKQPELKVAAVIFHLGKGHNTYTAEA